MWPRLTNCGCRLYFVQPSLCGCRCFRRVVSVCLSVHQEPFTLFAVWFEEARIARASEPGAMCLSTVGPTGRPSARYVMLQVKSSHAWRHSFSHNGCPFGALFYGRVRVVQMGPSDGRVRVGREGKLATTRCRRRAQVVLSTCCAFEPASPFHSPPVHISLARALTLCPPLPLLLRWPCVVPLSSCSVFCLARAPPLNETQGFDKRGFVWYTNFESRKSQEMSHNPYGALSFWWSEVQRAVRIEGVVCKVGARPVAHASSFRANFRIIHIVLFPVVSFFIWMSVDGCLSGG